MHIYKIWLPRAIEELGVSPLCFHCSRADASPSHPRVPSRSLHINGWSIPSMNMNPEYHLHKKRGPVVTTAWVDVGQYLHDIKDVSDGSRWCEQIPLVGFLLSTHGNLSRFVQELNGPEVQSCERAPILRATSHWLQLSCHRGYTAITEHYKASRCIDKNTFYTIGCI